MAGLTFFSEILSKQLIDRVCLVSLFFSEFSTPCCPEYPPVILSGEERVTASLIVGLFLGICVALGTSLANGGAICRRLPFTL